MFKRYLVACKQHHLITLIGLLILIICSQNISAQQQIAQDASRYLSTELPHLPWTGRCL